MGLMMADYHLRPWLLSHVERRKNVLYVYGYGGSHLSSSVDKLRRELPEDKFKVMCWDYPQRDCKAAVRFLEHKIKKHHIDIVVGSSLGAFITMCLKGEVPEDYHQPVPYANGGIAKTQTTAR